jgi:hypothetical protein
LQSDSNRFSRREDRDNNMATEGHRYAERKNPELMSTTEREKELADIRARMEELELRMQQNTKSRWVYEWPMRKAKVKWPVKELMARRQRRLLRGWLRHAENLDGPEEMVQICEPETGRILDEENKMGSAEDLKNCQEGREEIPNFQVGKELRSLRDLTDCQEDSQGISHCQLGNDMRSLRDLEDCQEGSRSIPYCQVGRDEQMRLSEGLMNSEVSWNQPEELTEQVSSEVDLDQQVQLTEDEDSCGFPSHVNEDDDKLKTFTIREADLRSLIMIGGIEIFLPLAQEEAEIWVADATTTEEQLVETVREEELEQISEAAQARGEMSILRSVSSCSTEADSRRSRRMSILRNGSIFSARRLKRLQPGSLQKKKKKKQTTLVWLICMSRLKPWREG